MPGPAGPPDAAPATATSRALVRVERRACAARCRAFVANAPHGFAGGLLRLTFAKAYERQREDA